eukprot:11222570-Lingulodinium_polyedra.AAC.1
MVEHRLQMARRQMRRQTRQTREAEWSTRQFAKEYLDQLTFPDPDAIENGQPRGVDARGQTPAPQR